MRENAITNTNSSVYLSEQKTSQQLVDILDVISHFEFKREVGKKKEKLYPIAFELTEEILEDLHNTIMDGFKELKIYPDGIVKKRFYVRSTDLTTDTYDSFEELIKNVGKDNDSIPERLVIEYEVLLYEPYAHRAYVEIDFLTDAKLEIEEQGILDYDLASVKVSVGGADKNWVLDTFTRVDKFIKVIKLEGIYKPLLLFRNKSFVYLMCFFTALIAQTFISNVLNRLFTSQDNLLRAEDILAKSSIEEKFDAFINYVYLKQTPLSDSMIIMVGSIFCYLVVLIISYIFYPKLIPKSLILLGLSKFKMMKYKNVYKFLVFTVLITSIIIPLVISAILNLF